MFMLLSWLVLWAATVINIVSKKSDTHANATKTSASAIVTNANTTTSASASANALPSDILEQLLQKTTRKGLTRLTAQFTDYYISLLSHPETTDHGKTSSDSSTTGQSSLYSHFREYPDIPDFPVDFSFARYYTNSTHRLLTHSINQCPRPEYIPRILSRKQISWKSRHEDDNKSTGNRRNKKGGKPQRRKRRRTTDTVESGSSDGNTGATSEKEEPLDDDAEDEEEREAENKAGEDEEEEDKIDNKPDKIHKYLVFVMYLPNHPFSTHVQQLVTTVGPMFPQITLVGGPAYEFKDMTSKYFIHSFPKILFFREGIYVGNFEDTYTAGNLAAQFCDWTYSLPMSIPNVIPPVQHIVTAQLGAPPTASSSSANSSSSASSSSSSSVLVQQKSLTRKKMIPLVKQFVLFNMNTTIAPMTGVNCTASSNSSGSGSKSSNISAMITKLYQYVWSSSFMSGSTSTSAGGSNNNNNSNNNEYNISDVRSNDHNDSHVNTSCGMESKSTTVSITVPYPNMEPFLGSMSDDSFAVWDSSMFLISGLYVFLRTTYVLYQWTFHNNNPLFGAGE